MVAVGSSGNVRRSSVYCWRAAHGSAEGRKTRLRHRTTFHCEPPVLGITPAKSLRSCKCPKSYQEPAAVEVLAADRRVHRRVETAREAAEVQEDRQSRQLLD